MDRAAPDRTAVDAAITALAREEGGRILALLATRFHDVDLADDAVQDALVQAVETWQSQGIPDNPPAWLYTVARNRCVDRLRRAAAAGRRLRHAAPELAAESVSGADDEEDDVLDEIEIGDELLRLMLLCCHPALDRDAQVALTLRLVGGLTTTEIAAAFLVPEATLAQRIVRAKRKIREAGIRMRIPTDIGTRVAALLTVLYLIFNEGYLTHGSEVAHRVDLADEAIRLTDRLRALRPDDAEVEGLLALEVFHRARVRARFDGAGELVLLDEQDRSLWDLDAIRWASRLLARALGRGVPGVYQLHALIASLHANAPEASETDWPAIVMAYERLMQLDPSPVVALNRAVAVGMADGPRAGLVALADIREVAALENYHLLHAVRGDLLARSGDPAAARVSLLRARELAPSRVERTSLDRRLAELG